MTSRDFSADLYVEHSLSRETEERLTAWTAAVAADPPLRPIRWHVRVGSYIAHAAIGASTRIEGNPLDAREVDALLDGIEARGERADEATARQEVLNYREALLLATRFAHDPAFEWTQMIPRTINATVMNGLDDDTLGEYRDDAVSVGTRFIGPDHRFVPNFMAAWVRWLRSSDWHPLVRTALLHLNLVAIHPWFNGNGRTARLLSALELMRVVRAPELISIETSILEHQQEYFDQVHHAVGPSYDPTRHSTTEWIEWYVRLHTDRLDFGERLRQALVHDIGTIVTALERRGDPPEWGPVILTAALGPVLTSSIANQYQRSPSVARAMLAAMATAGWLTPFGQTSARRYLGTALVGALDLRVPELVKREAASEPKPASAGVTRA